MTELLLTYKVEVAEKGNSHCKTCRKTIQKGEPRLKRMHMTHYGIQPTYICWRCAWTILEQENDELKLALKINKVQFKNLARTKKKCSKVLIVNTLMENTGDNK